MDENSQEMYLQNLEEFVLDEDKIVTYKWLSKTLNIHVNLSKQLLYAFSKDKQASVSATYLLAGRLRSTGENCIIVVGQDKYEETKSSFDTLSSEHVYSIQKSKQPPSGSTLFTADSQPIEGDREASHGAIRCKESVRRAAEELALLRVTVPPPASTSVSKSVKASSSSASAKSPVKTSPAKQKSDENEKETVAKDAKPKGGLAAMFAAQTTKASTKSASGASSSKNNAKGKKGAGISNFFSKVSKEEIADKEKADSEKRIQAEKEKAEKAKATSPAKVDSEEVMDVDSDEESKPASPTVPIKQEGKKTNSEPKNKNSSKVTKQTKSKRSKTKEKKDEPKKRKRIVAQDLESSDEDIFAEEKNPSSREASPEPVLRAKALESDEDEEDVIPPTPVAETSNGRVRRKRKVTKDKTFMDENGYMVTQKVNEYESFSESDTENADSKRSKGPPKPAENVEKESPPTTSKTKKGAGKAPAKKASPVTSKSPLKSKQQSLMSFFKKKD